MVEEVDVELESAGAPVHHAAFRDGPEVAAGAPAPALVQPGAPEPVEAVVAGREALNLAWTAPGVSGPGGGYSPTA